MLMRPHEIEQWPVRWTHVITLWKSPNKQKSEIVKIKVMNERNEKLRLIQLNAVVSLKSDRIIVQMSRRSLSHIWSKRRYTSHKPFMFDKFISMFMILFLSFTNPSHLLRSHQYRNDSEWMHQYRHRLNGALAPVALGCFCIPG